MRVSPGMPDASALKLARIFPFVSRRTNRSAFNLLGYRLREQLAHRAQGGQPEHQDGPGDLQSSILALQPVEALSQLVQLLHVVPSLQRHVTVVAVTSSDNTYRPTRCSL